MRSALVTLSMAAMAIGIVFVSSASAKARKADHLSYTGTFVSASNGKLVMTGRNGKEHTHAVAKDVKVTIDGKAGALAGLKKGMHISVTTDKTGNVTSVTTPLAQPGSAAAAAKPANSAPPVTPAKTTGK